MEDIKQLIDTIGEKFEHLAQADLVAGDPITLGDTTIVVLSRISLGFGGGGGEGEGKAPADPKNRSQGPVAGKGRGGGTGGGARVTPVAVAMFTRDGVEVKDIPAKKGGLEKLLDRIPEFIDRFEKKKGE